MIPGRLIRIASIESSISLMAFAISSLKRFISREMTPKVLSELPKPAASMVVLRTSSFSSLARLPTDLPVVEMLSESLNAYWTVLL